ncbi:hypothetical protein DFH11DRAFT_1502547 [Phellopilus nigrolimitatus]|nr:hypothetical protein DFH11DRAFT_1502547 [Phellopilus nigrolimitatus]
MYKNEVPLSEQRNLRPTVLSARIKKLADEGKLEDAIQVVLDAPKNKLNVIVWNTLLSFLMKAEKRNRAYSIYIEMKRRNFTPMVSTYNTMLTGMSEIEDWTTNIVQLEHCHSLYESYRSYMEVCKEKKLKSELHHGPAIFYLRILRKANLFQKLLDTFYSMDETGPLAPDKYIYSALFQNLSYRQTTDKIGNLTVTEQNASDAKFLWRKLEKDFQRNNLEVDNFVVVHVLRLLMNGRSTDQQFGLDIVRDYFGFAPPGEDAPPPRLNFEFRSFRATLELCTKAKKPRLCAYFAKQVMDLRRAGSPRVRELELNHYHMEEVLLSLNSLAAVGSLDESARAVEMLLWMQREAALQRVGVRGQQQPKEMGLQPSTNTYALALAVCWRCVDWARACEVYTLATQLAAEEFVDGGPSAEIKKQEQVPTRKSELLNIQASAYLARTALATDDRARMRQCLRMMLSVHDVRSFYERGNTEAFFLFFKAKLASAVVKMINLSTEGATEDERFVLRELKKRSQEVLVKRVSYERLPSQEEGALGSQSYMEKMQQAIDFELAAR